LCLRTFFVITAGLRVVVETLASRNELPIIHLSEMKLKRNRITRLSGFTLLEVLIAMFVVCMCALMVAATMPVASASRHKSDLMNRASGLAQKQLEAIRGEGYVNANASQLAAFGLIDSAIPIGTNKYSFTNSDSTSLDNPAKVLPQGTGSVQINAITLNLTEVIVTLTWKDSSGNQAYSAGIILANL